VSGGPRSPDSQASGPREKRSWQATFGRHPALIASVVLMLLWVAAYRQISAMDSGFFQTSLHGMRGLGLYLAGYYGEAARAYRIAGHGLPERDYWSDPSGEHALRAGNLEGADRRARATLLLVPEALEPIVTLGDIALERGKHAEALARFDSVLERQPEHADALYLSVVALARGGSYGPAIDRMNHGLRLTSLGDRAGTYLRVLELAGDLVKLPGAKQPACLLGQLHDYLRTYDPSNGALAMKYARRAIAAGDRPADAYVILSINYDRRGDHAEALRAAEAAIAADSKHAEAYRWAAVEARKRGDGILEQRMTLAAFRAAPADPFYLARLRQLFIVRLGDPHMMASLMKEAVAGDPRNALAHEYLSEAARLLGDRAGYENHARMAKSLDRAADIVADDPADDEEEG
jgi:tetratricopeptide (TPR) repeat protein